MTREPCGTPNANKRLQVQNTYHWRMDVSEYQIHLATGAVFQPKGHA